MADVTTAGSWSSHSLVDLRWRVAGCCRLRWLVCMSILSCSWSSPPCFPQTLLLFQARQDIKRGRALHTPRFIVVDFFNHGLLSTHVTFTLHGVLWGCKAIAVKNGTFSAQAHGRWQGHSNSIKLGLCPEVGTRVLLPSSIVYRAQHAFFLVIAVTGGLCRFCRSFSVT